MTDAARGPEPFILHTEPAALDDLRARLRATRWPDAPEDAGWSLGADVDYLRELVAYWADEFDWSAQEAALARLPHFRVALDGLNIHFVHARAATSTGSAFPLVLTHGWPDSFWRYTKVIPLLTDPGAHGADPADAFDVIVPDVPGFGYSDRPTGPPLDSIAVAGLWAELMSVLAVTSAVTSVVTWHSTTQRKWWLSIGRTRDFRCISATRRTSHLRRARG